MKVAVLSGKGGAGKTFISTNLAYVWEHAVYVDCDVEAPNGHIFFHRENIRSENIQSENITVKVPIVDPSLCNGCRLCTNFCKFNALAYFGGKVKIFEDICHHCLGCQIICPNEAISMKEKEIGIISEYVYKDIDEYFVDEKMTQNRERAEQKHSTHGKTKKETKVLMGKMNIGEVSGVPVIQHLMDKVNEASSDVIIDCPPGSACVVMESIKDVDYCVLVCEASIFGLHNVKMVYELVKLFKKPCGLIINKCSNQREDIQTWIDKNQIKVLGEIPFDRAIHQKISSGQLVSGKNTALYGLFSSIKEKIVKTNQL